MRIVAAYMTTGPNHVVFVRSEAILAAFPSQKGARVYLSMQMDQPLRPSLITQQVPSDAVGGMLVRHFVSSDVGSVIDVNASVEEVAEAAGLVLFDLRVEEGVRVAISKREGYVVAIAPAINEAGNAVGSNIFLSRAVIETDSRVAHVREQVPEVMAKLEWDGKVVQIGKPYTPPPPVQPSGSAQVISLNQNGNH